MKTVYYFLILLIVTLSCNTRLSQEKEAIDKFESKLHILERYFNEETVKGNGLDEAIMFLEQLTNIKSDIGDGYEDIKTPTIKNLNDWQDWYKENKHLLYWDDQEQKVKVKTE